MTSRKAVKAAPKTAPAEPSRSGFGAFVARQVERFRASRPDHSFDGFVAAIRHAIDYCGKRDWNSAEDMCEEIEAQMRERLRVPDGVYAEFVARHRETKQPRILIVTNWGFREAVEGQLSFNLHFRPERSPLRPIK